MLIAVFSDTHGDNTAMLNILENNPEIKACIHCGDVADDIDAIKMCFPRLIVLGVRGNNDFFTDYPKEIISELGGMKFFITHGHRYAVKMGDRVVQFESRSHRCNVCVYGHTHRESLKTEDDGLIVLNPGSSRDGGTYALIDTETKQVTINNI